ncbi:hypothetical protein [Secundilactobacillus collinoides]|nr:hypothetical protein [Secundilactobacillus collinoides]
MLSQFITAYYHFGMFHMFHVMFRENPVIGIGILVALVLWLIYRYFNNRR